ncbi:MAG: hypothetical protein J6L64_04685 [Opitutales bacterium]|nr:hypothetical protein [Opitutales bacterium]
MKPSKFFLSTLIAASAMTATAYAENLTATTDAQISESKTYDVVNVTSTATVTVDKGAVLTTTRYTGVDADRATTTLNIDGTMTVLGGATNGQSGSAGSFNIAHWSATGTVNVNGTLNLNSGISVKDGYGVLEINSGGVVNFVDGIHFAGQGGSITLSLNSGGRMNVGANGIDATTNASWLSWGGYNTTVDVLIKGGTVGILGTADEEASWSSSRNFLLEGSVIFDTTKYIMAADGNSSAAALDSDSFQYGNIALSGNISMTNAVTVVGEGTLDLSEATVVLDYGILSTLASSGFDTAESGQQTVNLSLTVAQGAGSVSGLTASKVSFYGVEAGTISEDFKTASFGFDVYNIAAGDTRTSEEVGTSSFVHIAAEGTLDLGETEESVSLNNVVGDGSVKIVSSADGHAVSVVLSEEFTGTVDFTGKFNTGMASIARGATLALSKSSESYASLWGDGTLVCDVLFKTDYQIGDTTSTTIGFTGSVVGEEGTTITVNETVNGYGVSQIGTANFDGTVSFDKVNVRGVANFKNSATIRELQSSGTTTISGSRESSITTLTSTGTLDISGGTNTIDTLNISGGTTTISGGTTTVVNDVEVSGGTLILSSGGQNGPLSGGLKIGQSGLVRLTVGDATGWGGSINSLTILEGGELRIETNSNAGSNQTFNMSKGIILQGGKITGTNENGYSKFDLYNADSGLSTLASSITAEISAAVGLRKNGTFTVAKGKTESGVDLLVSGMLTNYGQVTTQWSDAESALIKLGEGTMKLSGDNQYWWTGATIKEGVLVAASTSALGTGKVAVSAGATLTFATTVSGVTGGVEINEGATFAIDLTNFAQTVSEGDKVGFTILMNTALTFNGADASTLTSNDIDDSYFDEAGSTLGSYSDWAREWAYNTDTKTLSLTLTIPEPSAFGLLAGVGALVLCVSRRKRRK